MYYPVSLVVAEMLTTLFRIRKVPTSICYFDCTPSCTFEGESSATVCKVPETLAAVVMSCDYRILNSATILVKYTVNMEALDSTGNWSCEYQGVRARPLLLQAAEQQTSTQPLPPPRGLSSTESTTAEPVVVEASMPNKLPDKKVGVRKDLRGPSLILLLVFNLLLTSSVAE
ncbi:unnamed protein product [Dibothriocephalus latus]|uniref:Uncharacterized protein n=1 Tax=Dibothriocephalus latus TaxID=60516 RepID=A0A3P7NK89_DIBLA|nr:unnamed protein product [Dibothriocephalus latus]